MDSDNSTNLSLDQWGYLLGNWLYNKKLKKLKVTRSEVEEADRTQLTLKVPHGSTFIDHAKESVVRFKNAYRFYGSVEWRKLLWWKFTKKQRAYNFVLKKICFGFPAESIIVAFGDGKFPHARKYAPAPVVEMFKKLKQKLKSRCIQVDEFKTSKICSQCCGELIQTRKWKTKDCPGCNKFIDRDFNAAHNIRNILIYQNRNNGARSKVFARSNPLDAQRQPEEERLPVELWEGCSALA